MKRAQIYVDTIEKGGQLQNEGSGDLDDDGNDEKGNDPVYSNWTMVSEGVSDLCNCINDSEEDGWDEPADDVENDERDSADRQIPTYLSVKVDCSTHNFH
jgi:hypothetical protein